MIKVQATEEQRIRYWAEKKDFSKWEVVEINEEDLTFFLSNNFVKVEDKLGEWELQTTDGDLKKTKGVKKVSSSSKKE